MNKVVDVKAPRGLTWEQMKVGLTVQTSARTITETDLVNFISGVGFTEGLFIDARHAGAAGYKGRLAPGALTFCLAEGLVMQTNFIQGTGMALVHIDFDVHRPVYIGDTIECVFEITESRPASTGNRGVVTSLHKVLNQDGEEAMTYTAVRIIRGAEPVSAQVGGTDG